MSYPMYHQVDFSKIISSKPEKKEFTDAKGAKGNYHSMSVSYDKGESTGPFYFRLPIVKFWPLTAESDSLAIIHDPSHPEHKAIQQFYASLRKKGGEFLFKHQDDLGKVFEEENIAVGMFKSPVHVKREGGKVKGNGTTYLRLLRGSVSSNSSLFIGPDRKVYPKKKFFGYTIEGSPLVRVDSVYVGNTQSFKQTLVQVDIKTIVKVNSKPVDESVPEEDDETKQAFLEALSEGGDDEEEEQGSAEGSNSPSTPPKVSEKVKDETMDFLNSVNSNPIGKEKPSMPAE
ncbi:Hypothetical protein BQ3484_110 [Cedratvirus A11]|uniref:Uncharacterized protein n=1 Tax=Cedratvirus A11 TaxID=1903266 RepID=A0A1M7XUH6_9VIRU|nr:Hypothetical protein BQ3484_110 [Cedratvirus A11]SHO33178.1 Hypothetical protein BQ3484_110 [Cedratvirus A11]